MKNKQLFNKNIESYNIFGVYFTENYIYISENTRFNYENCNYMNNEYLINQYNTILDNLIIAYNEKFNK